MKHDNIIIVGCLHHVSFWSYVSCIPCELDYNCGIFEVNLDYGTKDNYFTFTSFESNYIC